MVTNNNRRLTEETRRRRSITELSCSEARDFFLKGESYCLIDLPHYFTFDRILTDVSKILDGGSVSICRQCSPRELDSVNHIMLNNKDGDMHGVQ